MPTFTRGDVKARGRVPLMIKILIFGSLILGLWFRSCWRADESKKIIIDNIRLENQTMASIDVIFDVDNQTLQQSKKKIMIELYTSAGQLICKTMTTVEIAPKKRQTYVRVLDKWERVLREGERLVVPKVYLYSRSRW